MASLFRLPPSGHLAGGDPVTEPWRFVHCPNCGRRLVEMRGALVLRCKRCGATVTAETTLDRITVQACLTTAKVIA